MPRRSSGPKLWYDKARNSWTIIDGRKRSRTGFGAEETARAEAALGDYIASKHTIRSGPNPLLADVLSAYSDEKLAGKISEAHILYDIAHLTKWWGTKCVAEINSTTCKAYVKHRKGIVSARRELAFLGASVKHWHAEHGPLKALPVVILPPAPHHREHWMTREQAARFLWEARKKSKHLARFFIIGWYTGTRRSKICGLRWSMVDFKTKIMQRRPPGELEAKNKKAPPVRMGERLMAHMKRWKRMDGKKAEFVITYQGKRVKNPIRIWDETRIAAKLPTYITPHILRHTRATNMMQQRKDPWESSKALGMSLEMLTKRYGHHHPDWQKDVSETR
jgi:integrase